MKSACYNRAMHRILIIEDDPAIREALEYNLKVRGFAISTAIDGQTGLETALAQRPDIILLDRLLPGMDGVAVCRELRRRGCEARIIMITALGTETDKVLGLNTGADDYLTKPFGFDELLARVKAQLRRAAPATAAADAGGKSLAFGDVSLDPVRHELRVNGLAVKVRPKEWQLLTTLANNPGVLFSRQQLADAVWGTDFLGSSRTIDVHVRRLREKVEKLSAYKFIDTVHGLGYRFELAPKVRP